MMGGGQSFLAHLWVHKPERTCSGTQKKTFRRRGIKIDGLFFAYTRLD
jgi:hypothetical protein